MYQNNSESEEDIDMANMDIPNPPAASGTLLLPAKSKDQYERAYKFFMDWCRENHRDSISEDVLLAYFQKLSERMRPSSLWATYSMLRMTIKIKNNIDISKYPKLCAFLKSSSNGYKPKKSKTLTPQQIRAFLSSAPDEDYLFTKVGLIFGLMGACSRRQLMKIETTHVEDLKTALLVHILDTKTKSERHFVIAGDFYNICKKYMEHRPANLGNVTRFFLNYQRGKCTNQPVGINKFGSLPTQVAKFLKLSNPSSYTSHYLRRSSGTILVGSGADKKGGKISLYGNNMRAEPVENAVESINTHTKDESGSFTNLDLMVHQEEEEDLAAQTTHSVDLSSETKYNFAFVSTNDSDFNDESYIKPEIEENEIKQIVELDNPECDNCHKTLKQNGDLREEVRRLSLVVEELKHKLHILQQKETFLERTVQSVKDIVNKDMPPVITKREID